MINKMLDKFNEMFLTFHHYGRDRYRQSLGYDHPWVSGHEKFKTLLASSQSSPLNHLCIFSGPEYIVRYHRCHSQSQKRLYWSVHSPPP